jgi:hypothetical protein
MSPSSPPAAWAFRHAGSRKGAPLHARVSSAPPTILATIADEDLPVHFLAEPSLKNGIKP